MDTITLSAQQLRNAADLQERIESLQGELRALLGGTETPTAQAPTAVRAGARRQISAAGIERIRAAQRARWAKAKRASAAGKSPAKPKRRMSNAGRARLAALAKARWAKAKQQGRTSL
jgi:hypothetical protein